MFFTYKDIFTDNYLFIFKEKNKIYKILPTPHFFCGGGVEAKARGKIMNSKKTAPEGGIRFG
ncbi:MAG: hypothetical protein CR975_02005 [Gammaproteobacteria bacterium]|nr:MAG: hypothetical protein CR975_02005 [Gammaproteobacteria bacterium]